VSHPSTEELAEHLEGVLDPPSDDRVRAHLQDCAECAATARELAAAGERLREAAEHPPPMPEHVVRRLEAALAAESRARSDGGGATSLHDRRRGRRRLATTGLLAAAAVTVAAVGLGEVLSGGGGSDGQAAGGSAGRLDSAELQQEQAGGDAGTSAAPPGVAPRAQDQPSGPDRLGGAAVIAGVAARHEPGTRRHERARCVDVALQGVVVGGPAPSDADAPLASYAVDVPAPGGGTTPGAVVLRTTDAPVEGLLVACEPRPRVVLRRDLRP
jgi:hypothetical protein